MVGLVVVAGGSYGVYYTTDYYRNILTSYDVALIDFLEGGGKIKFKVGHGNNGESDLTGDFPSFESNKTMSFEVKISTKDNGVGTLIESNEINKKKVSRESLKKVNGGNNNDWSWNCRIVLNKGELDVNELEEEVKNRIFKSTDKGMLGILKENQEEKDRKIDFIRKCAKGRGLKKNKEINGGKKVNERKIEGEIAIELDVKDNKLTFKNRGDLDY